LAGHAAHIGKIKNDYNISVGKSEDHLDELWTDGRIILRQILKNRLGTGFIWLRIGPVVGSSEHSNDPSCSISGTELLQHLSIYYLLASQERLHGVKVRSHPHLSTLQHGTAPLICYITSAGGELRKLCLVDWWRKL
jgi:hypothetical protein